MNILAASLVILFFLANPCPATLHDILHSFQALLSWTHGAHTQEKVVFPVQENRHDKVNRFDLGTETIPLSHNRRAKIEYFAPVPGNFPGSELVEVKGEKARPIGAIGGLQIDTVAIPVALVNKRPVENTVTAAGTEKHFIVAMATALASTTSTKAPSVTTKKHIEMIDLKIPGGEKPDKEDIPDIAIFRPQRPLGSFKKPPMRAVPGNDILASSMNDPITATPTTEPLITTKVAPGDSRALTSVTSAVTVITSTRSPSTEERARESEALPESSVGKGQSQLALDVNDLFQIMDE